MAISAETGIIQRQDIVPSENGVPLLGVLPKILGGDPFEYLKNMMLKHGDLVRLNFGVWPVYLVSNPDYLQRILRDNYHNYRKPDLVYTTIREIVGNGLVTSSGDFWLRQRRMIQPHLHRKQLAQIFSDMTDTIAEVLNGWVPAVEKGTELELGEKAREITIKVITRTMFGKGLLSEDEIAETGQRTMRIVTYAGEALYSGWLPKWLRSGWREFDQNMSAVRVTVNRMIAKCRQNKGESAGLVQMMLDAVDEETNEQMTEQQLFDETMTIFMAGYETTATVLTWFGVALEKYPEILEKLRAEIDQVLGDRTPAFEDMGRLVYTRQVFMELMRMYSTVPFIPRALNEADQLGNYHLPANAIVLAFCHGVHHNPQVWDDPERFDPERFSSERSANRHAFAYVPFSGGPRKCAGDEFALLEGPLAMAMLLQKYDLHVSPNQTYPTVMGATMRPKNGVKVTLSLREKK